MKTNLFFAAGMLIAAIATGQNKELTTIEVNSPAFVGNSPKSINDFLQQHMVYPAESYKWRIEGTEVIQFVVSKEGNVSDFKVINSVSREIDNEVIHLLKLTNGMWMSGSIIGEPADMEKEVSLVFKLSPASDFVEKAKWNMNKGNELLFLKDQPKQALKYFDMAINYLPNNDVIHGIRGLCKYKMGNENDANRDWERANILAERNGKTFDFKNLAVNSNNLGDFERMLNYVEK